MSSAMSFSSICKTSVQKQDVPLILTYLNITAGPFRIVGGLRAAVELERSFHWIKLVERKSSR